MFQQAATRRRSRLSIPGILSLGLLALWHSHATSQEVLRKNVAVPGDAATIQMFADDITTWPESGGRAFLLKGRVLVKQGLVSLQAPQGVVWVDEDAKKKTGVYWLKVYGEGKVVLEEGAKRQGSARAMVDFATRGSIDIKTYVNKARQLPKPPQPEDPVYQRAREVAQQAQPAPKGKIQKTSLEAPTPPAPPAPGNAVANLPPPPTPPSTPGPIQQTAHVETLPPVPPVMEIKADAGATTSLKTANPGLSTPGPPLPGTTTAQGGNTPSPFGGAIPPPPPAPADFPSPGAATAPPVTIGPPTPPDSAAPARPASTTPQLTIRPRSSQDIQFRNFPLPSGETAIVFSSGVILSVTNPADKKGGLVDIEADRVVVWTRGDSSKLISGLQTPQGDGKNQPLEFYLAGHVEIRTQQNQRETTVLRADEVYYDVSRNVALAIRGDLEIHERRFPQPIHVRADEIRQLGPKRFEADRASVFSTLLPSDPGLQVLVREVSVEETDTPRRTIFRRPFIDRETGEEKTDPLRLFRGRSTVLSLEGIPIFYFPYLQGDVEDPLGPLDSIGITGNRVFGLGLFTTWNVYDLLGLDPIPGTRWKLYVDYLSERGPSLGTDFDFAGRDLWFGIPGRYEGTIKARGIYDDGRDILGGDRGELAFVTPTTVVPVDHPDWRGRFTSRVNVQEMPYGFSVQAQVSALSDQNFLEQYYKPEFDNGLNQETFFYIKQQQEIWAWTALVEPRIRNWVTETQWLPRADGYVLGASLFDLLTYNVHGSLGYARLRTTDEPSFAYAPTDVSIDTGRFDLWQDISLPFNLGPFRVVPYLVGDLAYYTQDLTGDDRGRLYGGGGLRTSLPLSRLYPEVQSELLNLNGIYHKILLSGNYFVAHSDTSMTRLPQLDRLNDDASDQALRDIRPRQPTLNPANAAFLTTSPLFDPQFYALRRLVDNRVDTLDSMDVLQLELRQRWQTKRGFPGNQHVIDWMSLNLGASIFPHSNRDNFGETVGILQYDWVWNIGDRTALVSDGWAEAIDHGPRVFNFGTTINRPDNTNFYLGYRHIDPLESRAVVGALTYAFSGKYALTASTVYDFGVHTQTNSLVVTRIGTDLQVSLGVSYNSILNNFGVTFEVLPTLIGRRGAPGTNVGGVGGIR